MQFTVIALCLAVVPCTVHSSPNCELGSEPDPSNPLACTPCSPGFYRGDPEWPSCYPCSPGWYQNLPNSTECEPCFDGSFSAHPASDACTLCDRGQFSIGGYDTSCTACPANTFADQVGSYLCQPCTTWAITTPHSTVVAPFPSTVLAEGVSPIDCSVQFRTDKFLIFFFFLASPASITPQNTRLYKRATALALGTHDANALMYATPLNPEAVQDAVQLREIILQAVGIDVFSPLQAFLAGANSTQQNPVGLLYFVVHHDDPNKNLAIAMAQQIRTQAFRDRLNLATASLMLPPVVVVPESVQYYSPATSYILPVPMVDPQNPSPPPSSPRFSAASRTGSAVQWVASAGLAVAVLGYSQI